MKCAMCGKETSVLDTFNPKNLVIPIELPYAQICNECGRKLNVIQSMRQCLLIDCNDEQVRLNAYRTNILDKYDDIYSNIVYPLLESKFKQLTDEANGIYKTYYEYENILSTVSDILEKDYKALPPNQVHYGYSTFAVDDGCLFFMKYGKPIIHNRDLRLIRSVKTRYEVATELKNNVIEKKALIDVIPLDDIIYFQEKGDLNYSTSVSGGGSKGVSYSGAIIGGLLFGPAGAVIGGMRGNKIEAITSKAIKHDDRYVIIRYRDNSGKTVEQKAPYGYYDVFNSIIPEKEYSYLHINPILQNKAEMTSEKSASATIPVEELKALKELLDIGIITEDEFDKKKKQLLGI